MRHQSRRALCAAFAVVSLAGGGSARAAQSAQERFEVAGIKAVRPRLEETIAALGKGDVAAAKTAFEAYDVAWNGIETYINTRSRDLYTEIEVHYQAGITKGLNAPTPDTAALLADAKAMLAKYDEAIAMAEKGMPLNPRFDDVARLRIARSPFRLVNPALMAGNVAKARAGVAAFREGWSRVGGLVKAKSEDAFTAVDKGLADLDAALKPATPDVTQATALASGIIQKYNAVVNDVTKEARGQ